MWPFILLATLNICIFQLFFFLTFLSWDLFPETFPFLFSFIISFFLDCFNSAYKCANGSGSDWKYSSYINYSKSLRLKFGHTSGLGISTSVGYSPRACPKLHVLKGGLASSKLALQIPCIFPNLVFLSLEPTSFAIHDVKAS